MITFVEYALLYLLVIEGGNHAVRFVLDRVPGVQVQEAPPGLAQAGRWIGYLERLMILTMILAGAYNGVGFVFAGKAIARFQSREQTEYYLLGTFASFAWAVFWGAVGNVLI
ncbi:hypothetical protein [Oceanithermus desulfurans]|uniref:Uncharacterized protein n=2 Tax=Oceanithermus desulfurans TaxID=227924 RepID=A0A511RIF9_9DEIN|nr:hypothetical protein [Oceanithermus desulfurans]MBB6028828.1 hypothetical protein [Oceanithermus desulfurans]GEM88887.1 hypothetical protein ODE01S_03210 [Oceanithermus desulfurans NBRC 100063]